jgi:type IV fimbrial biogenesis protein FimU
MPRAPTPTDAPIPPASYPPKLADHHNEQDSHPAKRDDPKYRIELERSMSRLNNTQGFTLVELMIILALLATVVTVAIPSFSGLIQNNKLKASAEELKTFVMLARDEAFNSRKTIKIDFAGDTNWEVQRPSNADEIVSIFEYKANKATVSALNANRSAEISELLFRPNGAASAGASFTICVDDDPANGYLISVEPSGRIELHPKGKQEDNITALTACN